MEDNIKMDLQEMEWEYGLDCCGSGKGQVAGFCKSANEHSVSIICGKFLD